MEEKKVIRMDEHKNKNKVHKLSGKKILLGIVTVLILTVAIIAGTCKTKQIKISGLSYYTEAEVKKAVVENGYIDNSVAYFLKCKIASPDLLPFIDSIHVKINRPDTITVEVKEKKRAGCLLYNGKYVYFDKNGYALESYEKKYDDVPLVTGLKYDELVMQEKIPVKKEKVFSYLLELTTAIDKYNLPIDQIYIKEDGNALLISDKITVDLYNKKDIDIKISELAGMLKKVKGKSGTIDMKYFSEDHKIAVFQPKKS